MSRSRSDSRPLSALGCLGFLALGAMLSWCAGAEEETEPLVVTADSVALPPDSVVFPPDEQAPGALVPEVPGVAVAVLFDNSASMNDALPEGGRNKDEVARDAVARVLEATAAHAVANPGVPVKVAIYTFSDTVANVLPLQAYDSAAVRAALRSIPPPRGATAIGDALWRAGQDLRRSGLFRKHLMVLTDGENTVGTEPRAAAGELYRRSEGGVAMHFIAFDVSAESFAFAAEYGGAVLPAARGDELRRALTDVYQKKILAEAADYGDGMPQPAAPPSTTESRP